MRREEREWIFEEEGRVSVPEGEEKHQETSTHSKGSTGNDELSK